MHTNTILIILWLLSIFASYSLLRKSILLAYEYKIFCPLTDDLAILIIVGIACILPICNIFIAFFVFVDTIIEYKRKKEYNFNYAEYIANKLFFIKDKKEKK